MSRLAERTGWISESLTLKLNAMVQSLKKEGKEVFNLTAGEPDFDCPEVAKEAVVKAARDGKSKYTPVPGIPELREQIAIKTNRQQPSVDDWTPDDIVVSNGGKQALFNTLMAITNPGDEVIVISPYWLSYPEMIKVLGAVPKVVKTRFSDGFKLTSDQLREAISDRTKAVIFNSPSNPSGVMYTKSDFNAFAEVLRPAKNAWIISDEIYDRITFEDSKFCSFLESAPDLRDRCVTVNGMSKSAAMTGWRAGWLVGPVDLVRATKKIQGQTTSGINALAQWASVAALKLPDDAFSTQLNKYRKRRAIALEKLQNTGKIKVCPPMGAFYAFAGIGARLRDKEDSLSFAENLLKQTSVAVVPGTPFGEKEFVRISFATDEKTLQEGCDRFVQYMENQDGEPEAKA